MIINLILLLVAINFHFMQKIKIAIIEDEFFAANELKDLVSDYGFEVLEMHHSAEEFLSKTKWEFDAAIVDIFLSQQLTGIDVARALHERRKPFIFLTANQDHATMKQAAMLSPQTYISKPFKPNDVIATLRILDHKLTPNVVIRRSQGNENLHPNDILFIKSDDVYIEIITRDEKIVQRKLLKEIIEELPEQFVRIHRSYVVNFNYLGQFSANYVIISGHRIPVSRKYRNNLPGS